MSELPLTDNVNNAQNLQGQIKMGLIVKVKFVDPISTFKLMVSAKTAHLDSYQMKNKIGVYN